MKRKTNLECGFLFLYDWLPALDNLSGKEFKALMRALIDRQREGKALPDFRNPLTRSYAQMIEPLIRRRLEGAKYAQKGPDPTGDPQGYPTGEPVPQKRGEKEEINKNSIFKEKGEREIPPAPPASGPLSEQERRLLMDEGLPAAYLDAHATRAAEYARRCRRDVLSVLCEWWKKDKAAFCATAKAVTIAKLDSLDTEDFFKEAMARTYDKFTKEGATSPEAG